MILCVLLRFSVHLPFSPVFIALFQGFFVSIIYCFCNGEVSVGGTTLIFQMLPPQQSLYSKWLFIFSQPFKGFVESQRTTFIFALHCSLPGPDRNPEDLAPLDTCIWLERSRRFGQLPLWDGPEQQRRQRPVPADLGDPQFHPPHQQGVPLRRSAQHRLARTQLANTHRPAWLRLQQLGPREPTAFHSRRNRRGGQTHRWHHAQRRQPHRRATGSPQHLFRRKRTEHIPHGFRWCQMSSLWHHHYGNLQMHW